MRFLAISLRKDWDRVRRDPFSLASAAGIPLVLAVLMTLVFGRAPATPRGRLLLADEDDSTVSNLIAGAFSREPLGQMLMVEKVSRQDGRARIDRGEASAFLLIPQGLQRAFLLNQPFRLQLFTNPSERILPQIVKETLSIVVDGAFYVQRVAAGQLQSIAAIGAPTDQPVAQLNVLVNRLAANFGRYLFPPVIGLETEVVREKTPARSFASILLPSMIFMGLLFIANSLAVDIWKERLAGTLRRLASTPVSMAAFLATRVVFVAMVYGVVAVIGLAAAGGLAGMPVPNLPAAVLWMAFVGTVFYLLFLWIAVQPATPRAAGVLTNLIVFPLAMLGGCFFPFEWMPAWMARIGRLTPNGWALTQFQAILEGHASAVPLATSAALLTLVAALAFGLTLRRLRSTNAP
jgi:ABC-type multidrug transport system permease subunit